MFHALILGAMGLSWSPVRALHEVEAQAARSLYRDINAERRVRGLSQLTLDPALGMAAMGHVADMVDRKYFAHDSADGQSPFDRMRAAGCSYRYAGENIAMAPDEATADSALFASLPHRENTLSPNYTRVGIAAMFDAQGEMFFVEDFSG